LRITDWRVTLAITVATLLATVAGADLLEDVRFSEPKPAKSGVEGVERLRFELPEAAEMAVDGRLDEAVWSDPAAFLGKFRLGLSAVPARHTREAWACWDAENLYFAVRLQREPGTELRVNTREDENSAIWEDDEIEIFLDPFNSGSEYFQLIINSGGFMYDARHENRLVPDPGGAGPGDMKLKRESDESWASGMKREVVIEDEWWTAEMAVPLASLGLIGAPAGHALGFNITSADWDTGEYTCLSPTSNWHDPLQFGVLTLGPPRLAVTDLDLGNVGAGSNRLRLRTRDLSGQGGEYELALTLITDAGRVRATRDFSLDPGGSRRASLTFSPWGSESGAADWAKICSGPWRAEIQVSDAAGRSVYAARRVGAFAPMLTVDLGSRAVFTDGRPIQVAARLGLGSVTARTVELTARLLDERGRVVAAHELGRAGGSLITAWMSVDELAPGTYTFELVAGRDDERIARATRHLRVAASPFATSAP